MRLTTRLMQLASWLLLHRAVKEGEMSLAQANKEKTKVKLAAGEPGDPETIKLLPERLRGLIDRSKKLNDQVRRLDANIYAPPLAPDKPQGSNPVDASSACSRPLSSRTGIKSRKMKTPACRVAGGARSRRGPCKCARWLPVSATNAAFLLVREFRELLLAADAEPGELLLEARQAAAAIHQLLVPAGPGRVRLGSMSRCSTSPFLPQVVRVVNSVPSVILTVTVW